MRTITVLLLALVAISASAQQKPAPPSPPTGTEALTVTERTAMGALAEKEHEVSQQLDAIYQQERQVVQDIEAHHPGYHLDVRTGVLVKVPEAPKKADTPPAKK